jgi:hypothetical protein
MYKHASDPKAVILAGNGLKIVPVPRLSMAVATTGAYRFAMFWALELMHPAIQDLDYLRRMAPARFRDLQQQLCPGDEATIVHAGYDAVRGSGFGFVLSTDDFEVKDIPVGHTVAPAPDHAEPEHDAIAKLWESASRGWQVETLHRAIYAQQVRAFLAGKLAPGVAIGGPLHHVAVSAAGINITTAAR